MDNISYYVAGRILCVLSGTTKLSVHDVRERARGDFSPQAAEDAIDWLLEHNIIVHNKGYRTLAIKAPRTNGHVNRNLR